MRPFDSDFEKLTVWISLSPRYVAHSQLVSSWYDFGGVLTVEFFLERRAHFEHAFRARKHVQNAHSALKKEQTVKTPPKSHQLETNWLWATYLGLREIHKVSFSKSLSKGRIAAQKTSKIAPRG